MQSEQRTGHGLRPRGVAREVVPAHLLLGMRSRFGGDGADQMTVITFTVLALAFAFGQQRAAVLVLWFVTAQTCLAYLTAGVAKLVSAQWRSGTALGEILATGVYGHPWAAAVLARRTRLAAAACWSVIVLECTFPAVLIGVRPLTWALLAGAALFHVGTAILMRLNTFLWAFVATYPAVLYCASVTGRWP